MSNDRFFKYFGFGSSMLYMLPPYGSYFNIFGRNMKKKQE